MVEPLTPRELQIARLVQAGMSARDIAEELAISILSAHAHIRHIMRKTGFHAS